MGIRLYDDPIHTELPYYRIEVERAYPLGGATNNTIISGHIVAGNSDTDAVYLIHGKTGLEYRRPGS